MRDSEARAETLGPRILHAIAPVGGAAEGLMVRPRMALALARDGFGPRWLAAVGPTGTPTGAPLAIGFAIADRAGVVTSSRPPGG